MDPAECSDEILFENGGGGEVVKANGLEFPYAYGLGVSETVVAHVVEEVPEQSGGLIGPAGDVHEGGPENA